MSQLWWLQRNGRRFCITLLGHVILRWIVSRLSPLTSGKIWLAWVRWPLCGKPDNDWKCWIFIGWVTMTERISAVSWSRVTESSSTFRGQTVDARQHFDLSMRRFITKICGVEWGNRDKSGQKFDVFCAQNLGEKGPHFYWGGVVNRHHFRPTG